MIFENQRLFLSCKKQIAFVKRNQSFSQFRYLSSQKPSPIPVKAYYVATSIDLLKTTVSEYADKKDQFEFLSKCVTIPIDGKKEQFISVFKYGSVVFFNIPEDQHAKHIKIIRNIAMEAAIPDSLQHTEQFKMYVKSDLEKTSVMKKNDELMVRSLDSINLELVGAVMGQTVALDHFSVSVERMLDVFMKLNSKLEATGVIKNEDRKKLYTLLARNNNVIANVISRLGILEGSEAAWEDYDASSTWEALRKDFEIDSRFKDLSLRVDLVRDNARFYLDMLHTKESHRLEWIIIILIGAEIGIGLTGLMFDWIHAFPGSPTLPPR